MFLYTYIKINKNTIVIILHQTEFLKFVMETWQVHKIIFN